VPLFIGWGFDDAAVSEIVADLKKRIKARRDTGQIKRAEQALQEVQELRSEVTEMKALLTHFNVIVPVPSPSQEMERA
jgi:predicted metal-dependent RNase